MGTSQKFSARQILTIKRLGYYGDDNGLQLQVSIVGERIGNRGSTHDTRALSRNGTRASRRLFTGGGVRTRVDGSAIGESRHGVSCQTLFRIRDFSVELI
jgi:hypothetical protein